MTNYGKLAVFDISESGRDIGEKLILLLDERQREELAQHLLEMATKTRIESMCLRLKHKWQQNSPLTEFREGDLYICVEHRRVIVHGQEIALTVKEFDILLLLIMNPERVFLPMRLSWIWFGMRITPTIPGKPSITMYAICEKS